MAIPAEFSETEHLQNLIRLYVNKMIREDFRDLGGDAWEPDVTTKRGAMRYAMTHKDSDPIPHTLLRLFLYYFVYSKARDLQAPIYGIPSIDFQEYTKFHPQVHLFFHEDIDDVEEGYQPIKGKIAFRLMDESSDSMTRTKAEILANRIKTNFAANNGFRWHKGWHMAQYKDPKKGYHLQLYVFDRGEAKRVIEQVLDIQGHSPDWGLFQFNERDNPASQFPTIPGTERIYGKIRRKPRRRPRAYVRFRSAELHLHGLPKAIILLDRTNRNRQAVVKV